MIALVLAVAAAAAAPDAPPVKTAPKTADPAPAKTVTPMAERVVRFAALNKRNGQTQEFALKPGEATRFGTLAIRVRACETTPPTEQKLTGAFLQIDDAPVLARSGAALKPRRVFSGWMFAESPSLNPLQHPLYDVWVRSCTMSFPDTGPDTLVVGRSKPAPKAAATRSSAPKSPDAPSAADN